MTHGEFRSGQREKPENNILPLLPWNDTKGKATRSTQTKSLNWIYGYRLTLTFKVLVLPTVNNVAPFPRTFNSNFWSRIPPRTRGEREKPEWNLHKIVWTRVASHAPAFKVGQSIEDMHEIVDSSQGQRTLYFGRAVKREKMEFLLCQGKKYGVLLRHGKRRQKGLIVYRVAQTGQCQSKQLLPICQRFASAASSFY